MSNVRRSLVWTFAGNYSAFAIQFAATLILARILTPEQIGIFSVASVLVTIAHTVRDFGVGQYIIQEQELTRERIRTAFGIAILIGWSMAAVLVALSLPMAHFYKEPGVGHVIMVLALNFVLIPLATIPLALWRREMHFAPHYVNRISGALAHSVVAIVMALHGFGYWAMAWASCAAIVANVLVSFILRPPQMPWLPGFKEYRRVLSFCGMASSATVMKEVGTGAPDLVIGRVLGMHDVGLFGRAMGLIQIFERYVSASVLSVTLPLFSLQQRESGDVRPTYLRALSLVTGVAWPFFGVLAFMAYPIVRLMYGPQWDDAVPVARILCLHAAINVLFYFAGHTLIAVGSVKQNMWFEFVRQPVTIVLLLAAAPFGLTVVAAIMVASSLFGLFLSSRLLQQSIGLDWRELGAAVGPSLMVTVCTVVGPIAITLLTRIGPDNVWRPLALALLWAGAAWLGAVSWLRHPLAEELQRVFKRIGIPFALTRP
jgi:O-antigen/teichoic acid export membrane protein